MKKSSYLSERVYDAIPSEINMESLEYWKKILKEEGLQYVKKNHLEYFFGFINNCAFSSHEKSQPRNFVKLSLNKKAFRHEGEKMVFGAFYDPFVQEANRQLREIVIQRRYINESILFDFQQFLFNSLNNLCIRTLIYEMHICGQEGVLRGNESEQYQYYIDHFLKDKQYLNDLFSLYPVLERRINEIIQNAIDIYKEVIERIEKDADVLMKKFNITEKGFVVNHLSTDFSDSHKKGRRVFCVEFVSGDKILYKPRSLQNEIKLQEITNYFYRICNLGSYEYSILDKEMYGWCEIVIQRDCKSIEELSRYYQRIGIILFINYLLEGGDIHFENLIACNEYPVIIDAIVLSSSYHPELLVDGGARNLFFYSLANGNLQNQRSRSLIEYEIEDLLSGDIPYFYFRGSKKNIYTWDGREVKDFFSKPALQQIEENIQNLSYKNLEQQTQYIKITFNMENAGTRKIKNKRLKLDLYSNMAKTAEELAKELLDKIGTNAIYSEDGADVNWIGVKLFGIKENQWMIQALPNTLYDGTVGINLVCLYMLFVTHKG